jgi:hypothetical protein
VVKTWSGAGLWGARRGWRSAYGQPLVAVSPELDLNVSLCGSLPWMEPLLLWLHQPTVRLCMLGRWAWLLGVFSSGNLGLHVWPTLPWSVPLTH